MDARTFAVLTSSPCGPVHPGPTPDIRVTGRHYMKNKIPMVEIDRSFLKQPPLSRVYEANTDAGVVALSVNNTDSLLLPSCCHQSFTGGNSILVPGQTRRDRSVGNADTKPSSSRKTPRRGSTWLLRRGAKRRDNRFSKFALREL